jgi:EmrB/QacA subfamily drug resistance transporter
MTASIESSSAASAKNHFHPNVILGVCCLSMLLVGMDVTIVNVALPAIQRSLHASLSGLQWILDAYTLVVASLLMLFGSVSDRVGRRRIFIIGLSLFVTGSALCSLARSVEGLVFSRLLQGVGASMLNPVALSIVATAFPEAKSRARAVGIWGAVAGLSLALGPIIGGALTQNVGWRSIFWINVPVGLIAIAMTVRYVPESKAARSRPIDPGGQILVILGLGSLIYALIEGPRAGWGSAPICGLFGLAAMSAVGFVLYEPRRKQPLLDLRFFRSVSFSSAAVLAVCAFSSFSAFLFLNVLYLQQARGLSALQSGLCTLPLALMMMVSAPVSGRLVGVYGSRPSLITSGLAIVCSALILTQLSTQTPVWLLLLSYALFGLGLGLVNPAISTNAVSGMPLSQAGVAAAIASTSRQVGAALGVAVAGTLVNSSQGKSLPEATHPIWWLMGASGSVVLVLGWASAISWSKAQDNNAKSLISAEA